MAEIEIPELRGLLADLKQAADTTIDAELKQAHRDAADVVAATARPLIPQRTGALLGTLRVGATIRSGRVSTGKKKVPYAHPIHFGWPARGIAAQPFLTDALNADRDRAEDVFYDAMDRVVAKIGK
jgi:hypothetical protein